MRAGGLCLNGFGQTLLGLCKQQYIDQPSIRDQHVSAFTGLVNIPTHLFAPL